MSGARTRRRPAARKDRNLMLAETMTAVGPYGHVAGSPARFHSLVAVSGRPASKRSFMDLLEAFAKDRTMCASEGA